MLRVSLREAKPRALVQEATRVTLRVTRVDKARLRALR